MERSHTILCVDDEEGILDTMQRSLRVDGYKIVTAKSGAEGLDVFKREKVDLVISDQKMPNMPGHEFLKIVRERYPYVVRMIVSGHTDFTSLVSSVNEGQIHRFFYKPWDLAELRQGIKSGLGQNQLIHQLSGLLKYAKNSGGFMDNIEVKRENGSVLVNITAKKQMNELEEVRSFLNSIIESLQINKEECSHIMANAMCESKNRLIFTIDLGQNVALNVEIPVRTQEIF